MSVLLRYLKSLHMASKKSTRNNNYKRSHSTHCKILLFAQFPIGESNSTS